jgi:flagellar assembly protein FliH
LSEAAVSYDFEQLEPSERPPRDEHARLLAEAASEAQAIREQARADGHAEGMAEGLHDGSALLASAVELLAQAAAGVDSLRLEVAEAVERDAIDLALALAGKILAGSLQARPELVAEVVQGALRRASDRRRITVLLHPSDLETVGAAIGDLQSQVSGIELSDLQSDPRIAPGGVIVRTTDGEVDASVATQLERAREVVAAELHAGEPEA